MNITRRELKEMIMECMYDMFQESDEDECVDCAEKVAKFFADEVEDVLRQNPDEIEDVYDGIEELFEKNWEKQLKKCKCDEEDAWDATFAALTDILREETGMSKSKVNGFLESIKPF